ncbi:hypothetical protein N7499_006295 [Penicillium canescens]|nr:hypothetical protein N7499_006295 [Penicillium canescens]KAJ6176783.1 hypothetical protein N7485_003697 [Penicillium canescens]
MRRQAMPRVDRQPAGERELRVGVEALARQFERRDNHGRGVGRGPAYRCMLNGHASRVTLQLQQHLEARRLRGERACHSIAQVIVGRAEWQTGNAAAGGAHRPEALGTWHAHYLDADAQHADILDIGWLRRPWAAEANPDRAVVDHQLAAHHAVGLCVAAALRRAGGIVRAQVLRHVGDDVSDQFVLSRDGLLLREREFVVWQAGTDQRLHQARERLACDRVDERTEKRIDTPLDKYRADEEIVQGLQG